jgi:hypothetical protein
MSRPSRKNARLRVAGIVLLVLLAGYAAIGSLFSRYYKSLVLSRLPSLAAKATDSLYNITVQDIRINIFTRVVTVTGLRMSANLDVLQRRYAQGRPPHVVLDVTVPEAEVSGVHWNELKKEHELTCRSVRFRSPEIRIQIMPWWRERVKRFRSNTPTVSRVYARNIAIDDPHFDIRYSYGQDAFTVQSSGGKIRAHDWNYHPGKPFDTSRFFAAQTADARLDNISYTHPDALYHYTLGSIRFRSDAGMLDVRDAYIRPAVSYDQFYKRMGHRREIYECRLPVARLQGLQWRRLISAEHVLAAEHLWLDTPQLSIYFSKKPPPNPAPKPAYYPIQWLQRLELPALIRQISVWDGAVQYSETNARTEETGTLLFNYLRGALINVTNMPAAISADSECRLFVRGNFAYRASLAAVVRFSLKSTKGAFSLTGRLRGLDAGGIRDAVDAMAFADVKSLQVPDASFNIAGNEDSIWGRAAIQYSRLKVKLRKWNEEDSNLHSRVLLNFLANKILLYDANPMPGDSIRIAHIGLARGVTRSFFQTIWKGAFQAGIQTAVREEGAYDIVQRRKAARNKPKQKFFKGLFSRRR